MSEDPSEKGDLVRRRRTTRAGRRRLPRDRPSDTGSNPADAPPDTATLRDDDNLYASDFAAPLDDEFEDYEALGELDSDPGVNGAAEPAEPVAPADSASAPASAAHSAGPSPSPQPMRLGPSTTLRPGPRPVLDEDPEGDAPTQPQIRSADLPWMQNQDSRSLAAPSVVVARATVVGGSSAQAVAPAATAPPARIDEPVTVASVGPVSGELDASGIQLMDEDMAEEGSASKPRSPPPPPPVEARLRASSPGSAPGAAPSTSIPAGTQVRKPPPPPAAPKPARPWWERFFSEDYLMTVLPPTGAQIAKQVDFIEASLGVRKSGTILDVGCGLGLHAIELARRGYLAVGLDLSLAMITHASEAAQQQKLRLSFVHADIREMEFDGAFDAAICMGTTFGFFEDDGNRDVLARLYQALRPGGRIILDVVNRDYVTRFQPNLIWFEGDSCVCMEESDFNYSSARLNVKRTMMRDDGNQSIAEYSLRLYSLHELTAMMQQAGFRVLEVSGQEAIRGVFFGAHAPRILMLAERRGATQRPKPLPQDRQSSETQRSTSGAPGERVSAEFGKPPKDKV